MPPARKPATGGAEALAADVLASLLRERLVPRFVDSYVVEHARHAIQVHPTQYRDLLDLLQREALLAMTFQIIQEASGRAPGDRPKASKRRREGLNAPAFRRSFLTALARQGKWSAGAALDFQTDLRLYEDLLARRPGPRRARRPSESADHPFVDRCAILLDPSFLEQARVAASRALDEIERLASAMTARFLAARRRS